MEITQENVQSQAGIPVTVIKLVGDLDGSNFQQVITSAKEAVAAGASNLLLDMGGVGFMSSSGLIALHTIAMMVRNEQVPILEGGPSAKAEAKNYVSKGGGFNENFKLLNVQPLVMKTIEQVGYNTILQTFTNRDDALATFG